MTKTHTPHHLLTPAELNKLTGSLPATLRNDFAFHYVLHKSPSVLKSIICSLKGLNPDDVRTVDLMNPIDYSGLDEKVIILDVHVKLNNNEILVIELQCYTDLFWRDRSLLYLCRSFNNIASGDKYDKILPTTLIAIMDYSLNPKTPYFYDQYLLISAKTKQIYSPHFVINVLDLSQANNPSPEDVTFGRVTLAKALLADTWEDLKALIPEDPVIQEVIYMLVKVNEDAKMRSLLQARQNSLEWIKMTQGSVNELKDQLAERDRELSIKEQKISQLETLLKEHNISVD